MNDSSTIGGRIKQLRADRKLSAEKLAALIGRSAKTITRWESGKDSPRWRDLEAIADRLGIRTDDIAIGVVPASREPARLRKSA